jgi:hypothetical protein
LTQILFFVSSKAPDFGFLTANSLVVDFEIREDINPCIFSVNQIWSAVAELIIGSSSL